MEITNKITCPKCDHAFDINSLIIKRIKDSQDQQFKERIAEFDEKMKIKLQLAEKTIHEAKLREEKVNEIVSDAVAKKLKSEKIQLVKSVREEINRENSELIESYKLQLQEKSKAIIEMNQLKAQLERIQREKSQMRAELEYEMEIRLTNELAIASQIVKDEYEKTALLKAEEKDLLINSLKNQLKLAQKKIEQGSVQIQGEAQELVIEAFLKSSFPGDRIEEIKKGSKGGDCIHVIIDTTGNECGSVYYESKRSKEFQIGWIDKFKQDMRNRKVTFGVIVTEKYPPDMSKMGFKNGIIICSLKEFQGLCVVLRQIVTMFHQLKLSNQNTGDKMSMLYQFLTGSEFHGHLEAIVEGFVQMSQDLAKERRSMETLWKHREKQIQKVLLSTSHMYASIKGIAGTAVTPITELELPDGTPKLLTSKGPDS